MSPLPESLKRNRARVARWFAVLMLVLGFGVQFFRVQVLKYTTYALRSDENRIRALPVPAARGTIYDREGRVLAENVPGYSIAVLPLSSDSLRLVLDELAAILGHSSDKVERLAEGYRRHPNRPITVESEATFAEISAIEERRAYLPGGIVIEATPKRHYPWGRVFSHVIGYVAEISDAELKLPEFEGYESGTIVGQTGVERVYDRVLAGSPGVRYVEVNALGRIVGEFRGREARPPLPGQDLYLNVDLDLQRRAAELFPDTMRGAVVALDPRSGDVLAMYSAPSYDANAFVGGIEPDEWRALIMDPAQPLFNRTVSATYAPGSVFKLAIASVAMKEGYVEADTEMPIPCRGALMYYGRVFKDWTPRGHGTLNLTGAIRESCDVYFYQLALRVGLEKILNGMPQLGFGVPTGIDLPSEVSGTFPPSTEWYDLRYGSNGWTNSVVLNLGIGQGENAQSPLKLAQFFSAIANDGILPTPGVAQRGPVAEPAGVLPLSEEQLEVLKSAMVEVVNGASGTARGSRLRRWTLAGKTGTAQNPHGEDHAWFVGFAPAADPRIIAVAIVEGGGHGSSVAAPIISRLVGYFLENEGVPPEVERAAAR